MVDYKEIPQAVLLQCNVPVVVEKFRNKALSYKFVKDADLKFESVNGARVAAGRFFFDTTSPVLQIS